MTESPSAPVSFDRVATEYERTRSLPESVADSVGKYLASQINPSDWFLDAGCGTGRFTRSIAVHHGQTVGADVSPNMLAELRRLQGDKPLPLLTIADLRQLPFADAQFAGVLTVHVLHLIAEWKQALAEMWRVLQPGGCLYLGFEHRSPSAVRDFYMREGRRRDLLPAHPGVRTVQRDILPVLETEFGATQIEEVTLPDWEWHKIVGVGSLLADLQNRLYSSQWNISPEAHDAAMAATRENAEKVFGRNYETEEEDLETRMVLYAVTKP